MTETWTQKSDITWHCDFLSDSVFQKALKAVAEQPNTLGKLKWWLLAAPSIERWFQFELAYQLGRQLPGGIIARCESKWVDIVVLACDSACVFSGSNRPLANIELKVNGNWYGIGTAFPGIADDVAKIDHCEVPGIALALWVIAKPKAERPAYEWITKTERPRGPGISEEDIESRMAACSPQFSVVAKHDFPADEDFESLKLVLWGCRNGVAN